MENYTKVILNKGKEKSLLRKHPWIFSGALKTDLKQLKENEIVDVFDDKGQYLATGYVQYGSIAIRVLSFEKTEIKTEPTPTPVIQNPDVQMANENVPTVIKGRNVISTEKIELNVPHISIYVYDNSYIDGDTMSLFFNGKWIVDHYGVTKKKFEVKLNLLENTNNYLVLFANNLGKSPPNTAAIEFDDGKRKYIYRLSSDLKSCSAINFVYKK